VTTSFPLDPRGAVRVGLASRAPVAGSRDVFRQLGAGAARCDLGDEGLYLAEEIAAGAFGYGDDDRAALACLVLAAQIASRLGATRLPLERKGPLRDLVRDIVRVAKLDGELDADELVKRMLARAKDTQALGAVLGTASHGLPLVVDDNCLYSRRAYALEAEVAALVAARLGSAVDVNVDVHVQVHADDLSDEQGAAVTTALAHPLAVISGGPGTGKTRVAGAIVAALAAHGARVALAAPTGKAAHRLAASVARRLAAPVALPGQTLHRLLGLRPDAPDAGHDAYDPLPHDAVIVDEASMLDLALAARLLRAMRPGARLVLLGDARQLPSVDAGQVLADLVQIADGSRAPWCARLTRSFRAADDADGRAVLAAAQAIDQGQPQRLDRGADRVAVTRSPDKTPEHRGVELIDPSSSAAGAPHVRASLLDDWFARALPDEILALARRDFVREGGAWRDGDAALLGRLLAHHDARRILCATRGQPAGADAANAHLHERLLAKTTATREPEFLPGEPVILTANDHERGFYNGDTGVIARVAEDGAQRYRVILRRGDELIAVPIDAVRGALEPAWALTVHKSQGSEYDEVLILLPDEPLPIATRELVYTALTRARRAAAIVGPRDVLHAAALRSAPRHSGLAARVAARQTP
jgi:exodeoxyribonuclease V alpha subunit